MNSQKSLSVINKPPTGRSINTNSPNNSSRRASSRNTASPQNDEDDDENEEYEKIDKSKSYGKKIGKNIEQSDNSEENDISSHNTKKNIILIAFQMMKIIQIE
jgi:hypothetical protein